MVYKSLLTYDGSTRKRRDIKQDWGNTAWITTNNTRYVYDGINVVQERDESGLILAQYTWGPEHWNVRAGRGWRSGNFGNTLLLQQRASTPGNLAGGVSSYAGADPAANIRIISDKDGNVTDRITWKAFGEQFAHSGSTVTPYGFGGWVGYYQDAVRRLNVGWRVYDPIAGRWTSVDPTGFEGGDWNLYRYVENNPITKLDPNGLAVIEACFNLLNIKVLDKDSRHAFIVISDSTGRYYIRGGRKRDCPSGTTKCPDNIGRYIPSLGIAGPLTVCTGLYNNKAPDFAGKNGTPATDCITLLKDGNSAASWLKKFQQEAQNINRKCIPYQLLGPNSNSVARHMIRRFGIPDFIHPPFDLPKHPNHPNVNLPGWNTPLPGDTKPSIGTDPPFEWMPGLARRWGEYLYRHGW